jgi:hypothetical protein
VGREAKVATGAISVTAEIGIGKDAADGAGVGALDRRSVLGGIAALPVVYGIGAAGSAQAATQVATATLPVPGSGLARGVEQRYNAPLLTPGTRLVLPAGIEVTPVQDCYTRPFLASAQSAWPRMRAADGAMVDASIVPELGAATRVGMLSGFRPGGGWYELVLANKRSSRRVTWDAAKLPFLFIHGEFGGAADAPYNRFYTLALQPFSANPYSRSHPSPLGA